MPLKLIRDCTTAVFRRMGYVPISEMRAALAEKDKVEQELRHKTRNLEQQVIHRDRLESELGFLRELELAHARNESGTQQAVDKLDKITGNLIAMMQSVWPEAHSLTPAHGEAEQEEAKAA